MALAIRARAPWWLASATALAAVYVAVFAILGSALFARAPGTIAAAATFDLTITATATVWWFGVRRGKLPWWFAVATLSWGITVARARVPHAPLHLLLVVGGALEVASVTWLVVRIRRIVRGTRAARAAGPIGALEAGLRGARVPARVAAIFATELTVLWFALTGWFRRPRPGFAMRSSGWLMFAGVMGFLIIVETAAAHIALVMWKPWLAWLSTISSAYLLVWLAGDAQLIRLYPIAVIDNELRIAVGMRWRVTVPVADIAAIEPMRSVPAGALSLALLEPTVLVTLRAPVDVHGFLGRVRRADRLALTVDDPAAFAARLASQ